MNASDVASGFSAPANLLQLGMLALLFAGQLVTWWSMARGDRRRAVRHGEEQAVLASDAAAAVTELAASNERLAKVLKSLDDWARAHELVDARYQERTDGILNQLAEGHATLARTQENQQRQIMNLALDRAPESAAREVGATRRRRS